ncbi:hypothetical protein [Acidobacterium sp. S8]|uniref:hypothetical protein n=1 Tax=Acidobacterium sp. S8 TaxID=1641854 RepID=UPI00131B8658|nr:hypothetical protein [Acidobacterium sp. S8]
MQILSRAVLIAAAAGLLLTAGCETGRTNKNHAVWQHLSDETTTGKPDMAKAAPATGQPPVPGSPTAAGKDGLQPLNDSEARNGVGSEEGKPMAFDRQKKDPFERQ